MKPKQCGGLELTLIRCCGFWAAVEVWMICIRIQWRTVIRVERRASSLDLWMSSSLKPIKHRWSWSINHKINCLGRRGSLFSSPNLDNDVSSEVFTWNRIEMIVNKHLMKLALKVVIIFSQKISNLCNDLNWILDGIMKYHLVPIPPDLP